MIIVGFANPFAKPSLVPQVHAWFMIGGSLWA